MQTLQFPHTIVEPVHVFDCSTFQVNPSRQERGEAINTNIAYVPVSTPLRLELWNSSLIMDSEEASHRHRAEYLVRLSAELRLGTVRATCRAGENYIPSPSRCLCFFPVAHMGTQSVPPLFTQQQQQRTRTADITVEVAVPSMRVAVPSMRVAVVSMRVAVLSMRACRWPLSTPKMPTPSELTSMA